MGSVIIPEPNPSDPSLRSISQEKMEEEMLLGNGSYACVPAVLVLKSLNLEHLGILSYKP